MSMQKVIAKKKFGQNFLEDKNILNNIASQGDLDKDTLVIEIGPGTGNLTEYLLSKAKRVIAFEIDDDLIPILTDRFKNEDFILVHQDILTININEYINKYKGDLSKVVIVGNLPYYITTPIILGLLEQDLDVKSYVFMVQDEVADRLTAFTGKKDYNALSVLINYKTNSKKCFKVSPNAFNPAPNVYSAVVKLEPREITKKPDNEALFFTLNRAIFKQRRKTLANNLKEYGLSKDVINNLLNTLGFKPTIRPEELDINDIINLSNEVNKL